MRVAVALARASFLLFLAKRQERIPTRWGGSCARMLQMIPPFKITNFPPFLTQQLKNGNAFGGSLCFKLKYPTQKLHQFLSLFIIFC